MPGKLARVRWKMGQTLLPEHFIAQEDSLRYDSALRFRLHGLPAYGIASLRWNDTLLAEGVLSISAATIVMPSGRLLEIPDNASCAPLNLNLPASRVVSVYIHLLEATAADGADDNPDGGEVPRLVYRVVLSADQGHPEAVESLKLAEFNKDPQGRWKLSLSHIPPLLQLGTSPFLKSELDELLPALESFQYKLVMDSASYLSGSGLFTVKQCLKSVYRMQRLVVNLNNQVHPHPYHVYEALKEFYIEVCLYRDSAPKDVAQAYDHDRLATCLRGVLGPLKEQMQMAQKRSPHEPFTLRDGIYRIDLDSDIKQAKDIYFLIQKDKIHRSVSLGDLKLASHARLSMIHRMALEGIPLSKMDRPVLAHSFGPEVEFYLIVKNDEWDYAVRDGAVSFFNRSEFQDLEFYLYWSA